MKRLRTAVMLAVLAATALLVVLSIVGAFLGAEEARVLFNSQPLMVFWFLLGALLLLGFVYFRKLLRSVGGLAVHLGSVLVLLGAMAGSERGHAVAARVLGDERVFQGYMRIFEGQESDVVHDGEGQLLRTLPFKIRLEDFWIERYPSEEPWRLGVEAAPAEGERERRSAEIQWAVGEVVDVPFVDATLEVLQYLPSARPSLEEGVEPQLVVTDSAGARSTLPARVGQELTLESPRRTLKIVQIFSHLRVTDGSVVDVPGSTANPALKVEIRADGEEPAHRYAFSKAMMSGHGQEGDDLTLTYAVPSETGAVEDPETGLPAIEVRLRNGAGDEIHQWLIARDARHPTAISLAPLLGGSAEGERRHARAAFLVLAGALGNVRDYKSRLTVLDREGNPAEVRVIEVNDPLHYGGYHFYQHSYDNRSERFTVLGVRSDLGLTTVYVGFALLCLGLAWLFWVEPLRRRFQGSRSDGD